MPKAATKESEDKVKILMRNESTMLRLFYHKSAGYPNSYFSKIKCLSASSLRRRTSVSLAWLPNKITITGLSET